VCLRVRPGIDQRTAEANKQATRNTEDRGKREPHAKLLNPKYLRSSASLNASRFCNWPRVPVFLIRFRVAKVAEELVLADFGTKMEDVTALVPAPRSPKFQAGGKSRGLVKHHRKWKDTLQAPSELGSGRLSPTRPQSVIHFDAVKFALSSFGRQREVNSRSIDQRTRLIGHDARYPRCFGRPHPRQNRPSP